MTQLSRIIALPPLTPLTVLAWHHTPTGAAAGATPHASEGEQLLQCVSSVMARTRHGDEPAITDRLLYSHRNRFGRFWAADYLLSHPHRIKYFQLPNNGSKAIRAKMSKQFEIPYGGRFGRLPGSTPDENRVKPVAMHMHGEVRVRVRGLAQIDWHHPLLGSTVGDALSIRRTDSDVYPIQPRGWVRSGCRCPTSSRSPSWLSR